MGEDRADQQRVQRRRSGPRAPRGAPGSSRATCPARARRAPRGRWCPDTSASSIARPDFAEEVGRDAVELDVGVLERLVQPVGLALALSDLRLAIAGQLPQRPDRLGRHEVRLQQPGLGELAQPGGVGHDRSCAGDLLDVPGVDEHQLEIVLEDRARPASSTRRWPPSRPASPDAPPTSRASAKSPRTVVWNSARCGSRRPLADGHTHARRHLRLVDIKRRRALDDHLHHNLLQPRTTDRRPRGPRRTTSLRSVLEQQQSGVPGETPTPN